MEARVFNDGPKDQPESNIVKLHLDHPSSDRGRSAVKWMSDNNIPRQQILAGQVADYYPDANVVVVKEYSLDDKGRRVIQSRKGHQRGYRKHKVAYMVNTPPDEYGLNEEPIQRTPTP